MKVYTRVVIDMKTLETLAAESFEYTGPVAECKGGGSTTTVNVDKEYNARMASIYEDQQAMAREFTNLYKYGVDYDPTEQVTGYYDSKGNFVEGAPPATQEVGFYDQDGKWVSQADYKPFDMSKLGAFSLGAIGRPASNNANDPLANIPQWETRTNPQYDLVTLTRGEVMGYDPSAQVSELQVEQQQLKDSMALMPYTKEAAIAQTQLAGQQAQERAKVLPLIGETAGEYYKKALGGVDIDQRVNQARADVGSAFAGAEQRQGAILAGYGINPNSGRGRSELAKTGLAFGRTLAGASTAARTAAEEEEYKRLREATTMAAGTL